MIQFYAETIHNEVYQLEKEDKAYLYGVYLHGKLEKENGFDLVLRSNNDGENYDVDDIFPVEVIFHDGTQHQAIAYLWHSPSKYEKSKLPIRGYFPVCIETRQSHGLICAFDDEEANEYALQKFNERAWHI